MLKATFIALSLLIADLVAKALLVDTLMARVPLKWEDLKPRLAMSAYPLIDNVLRYVALWISYDIGWYFTSYVSIAEVIICLIVTSDTFGKKSLLVGFLQGLIHWLALIIMVKFRGLDGLLLATALHMLWNNSVLSLCMMWFDEDIV